MTTHFSGPKVAAAVLVSVMMAIFLSTCTGLHAESQTQQKPAIIGASKPPDIPNPGIMGSIFAIIAAKTVPTVVSVIPTKIDTVLYYRNPFYYFFGDTSQENPFGAPPRHGNKGGQPGVEKRSFKVQALGAGVIISADGLILSNYHVIEGANEIEVRLSDGRSFAATIVGSDSLADVAVIKIKEKVGNLPVAYFGNSDSLKPGDWTMAVGNPFALTSTVTVGVVSALNRQVESPTLYENFIQTDAAINPGNSGGALVNIKGELVGINTMIYTQTGGFMGIGFAVPINMARRDAEDIVKSGKVVRGWIGVSVQDITPTIQQALNLPNNNGALVSGVVKGQPAEAAGIHTGDVILSIDNQQVQNSNDLRNIVATIKPGQKIPVVIVRNGKKQTLTVTVVERTPARIAAGEKQQAPTKPPPPAPPKAKPSETFDIEVADLTGALRQKYDIPADVAGIVVVGANQTASDERQGLEPGDVIEEIKVSGADFQKVTSTSQFKSMAAQVKKGSPVMLLVKRGPNTFFVSFKA